MASEFLVVAEQVIDRERRALSAKEIVGIAIREGFFSDKRAGKTPSQTMKSKISVSIRRHGAASAFVRTAPGRFFLRRLLDSKAVIYDAPPLRPPRRPEDVLLFPTHWLDQIGRFQGIKTSGAQRLVQRLFESGVLTYVDRLQAEQLDDHKQVITYIMVTRGKELLSFRRGNYNRVEDFLRGARCIGFGGHVSASDRNLFGQGTYGLIEAAARELKEELRLPPPDQSRLERGEGLEIVAVLNDDSSANGRRHFAIILRYHVSDHKDWDDPPRNEKSITQLRWLNPESSPHQLFEFEYWSQLCLLEFYGSARITEPTYIVRRRGPLRPPHVLLVLGELGSGKSATTRVLRSVYSYTEVNSGAVLASILGRQPLHSETERATFQDAAWRFIKNKSGPLKLARTLWERIDQLSSGRVLIEGIRQSTTLDSFLSIAGERRVGTIFVHTPFEMAYAFYHKRSGSQMTMEDFIAARAKPVEREVASLVERADAVLFNWSGERAYRKAVQALMESVGVSP